MHSKSSPKLDPYTARVIIWDNHPERLPEKIIHAVKVSPIGTIDPHTYERALRETIQFEGFVESEPPQLRETLPYFPDLSLIAQNESTK